MSDLDLTYHQGYIEAGLTPTFTAQETVFTPALPDEVDIEDFIFEEELAGGDYKTSVHSHKRTWTQTARIFANQLAELQNLDFIAMLQ